MWCHDGKISLAGFISGIITTIFTSQIVLTLFSLDLSTFKNVVLCFAGPIGTYGLFCVITYFVTNGNDFAVLNDNFVQFCLFHSLQLFVSYFPGNKKSNCIGRLYWSVYNSYMSCSKCLETVWCLLFLHGMLPLQ